MKDLIANSLVARALVVGMFGGVALSLTSLYSRRGPMIYPVYAALLVILGLLLARHSQFSYAVRVAAALVGFVTASAISYATVGILAQRQRDVLITAGRLAGDANGVSFLGHLWRWGLLLGTGAIVSAALAFVSG